MHIKEKLAGAISENNSLLCVGLDSQYEKLPQHFLRADNPLFEFNKDIVDKTHKSVCGYKLNSAFYEALGADGVKQLKLTFDYIHSRFPKLLTILDAKRGDVGNTNAGYVQFAFEYLNADMITLHPYLGGEALLPFLKRSDKGSIVLCCTSNPGSGELQSLQVNAEPLYKIVAKKVFKEWNQKNNCLLVMGATYPQEMRAVRDVVGDMTFLVPGIGAQGGDLESVMSAGLNSKKEGMIISVSRSIIFSDATAASRAICDDINRIRSTIRT